MADQRITNLSYLEEMGMGEDALLVEMIELFLENTPESIRILHTHAENEEWENLAAEAHKFKPNLFYMGLEDAQQVIIEIEESAKNRADLEAIPFKIQQIENVCQKAYLELEEILEELKS